MIDELEKSEAIDKKLLRYLTIKVKEFDLETNYFLKKDDSDPFQKKFGNGLSVCADPDSACYGEWFFLNGGGFENGGFFC